MPAQLKTCGFWWQTMGFTRVHLVGVFATEALLCTIGMGMAIGAFFVDCELAIRLLLAAICSVALAVAVILASILSLIFFAAWPTEREVAPMDIVPRSMPEQ